MFEEFGPDNPPLPPAGALEKAITRGRRIRRQRRISAASAVVLSTALIGGFALTNPLYSNRASAPPAVQPTPAPPDYSPIVVSVPPVPIEGLDFGRLTDITTAPDGVVTLHVNRTQFPTPNADMGPTSIGMVLSGGHTESDVDGDQILTFTLDPKASIQATASLSKNGEEVDDLTKPETLTVAELIRRFKRLDLPAVPDPDTDFSPRVWLRHFNGADGPVTAIVDQFMV